MFQKLRVLLNNPYHALGHFSKMSGKVVGTYAYQRFIVVSYARTGSNLLIDMLNSHPRIFAEREIFRVLDGQPPHTILQNIFTRYAPNIEWVGFKIFYHHPLDSDDDTIWSTLAEQNDIAVIHLRRENILRTLVSLKIAQVTDVWRTLDANQLVSTSQKQVRFTPQELAAQFAQIRGYEQSFAQRFAAHPMITISYEQLIAHTELEFTRLLTFLSLHAHKPKIRSLRQNPEPLSTLIENYADLKAYFTDSPWDSFFDE